LFAPVLFRVLVGGPANHGQYPNVTDSGQSASPIRFRFAGETGDTRLGPVKEPNSITIQGAHGQFVSGDQTPQDDMDWGTFWKFPRIPQVDILQA
jgi:hypothetical protein